MKTDLYEAGNLALKTGDLKLAVTHFSSYIQNGSPLADAFSSLALTLKKLSRTEDALDIIEDGVRAYPESQNCWFIKGAIEEAADRLGEAVKSYQTFLALVESDKEPLKSLHKSAEQVKLRIPYLLKLMEKNLRHTLINQHGLSQKTDKRFLNAIDVLFGHKQIYSQQPKQFFFPELPQKQFYSLDDIDAPPLSEWEFLEIQKEAQAVTQEPTNFEPYLESGKNVQSSKDIPLVDNVDWGALYLIRDGIETSGARERFPAAFSYIEKFDLCRTSAGTPSVLFSKLTPGTHIPPHNGMVNTRLICHLPLIIPQNCGLRVGNETIEWTEGELIIFDDTIEHEAWNKGTRDRVVLLFDIWRPELSSREKMLVASLLETSRI